MPLATEVLPAGSGDRRSTDEDGWSADKTGDGETSPMSAAVPNDASLAWNASSTCLASAAIKMFLALRIRCAQVVAPSDEAMVLSSVRSWSRNAADASGPRIGLADFESGLYAASAGMFVGRK